MNQLTRQGHHAPAMVTAEGHATDVLAQHAAADALIGRLLTLPIREPRSDDAVMTRIRGEALSAGTDFYYEWNVKGKRGGVVRGPSIQAAEAIASACGNCGYVSTHIETPEAWIFTASFVDRETGMVHSRQYRQRRSQRTFGEEKEGMDPAREQDIAFQIGQSKAIRNVIERGLRRYVDFAVDMARKALHTRLEDKERFEREKARVLQRLAELDASPNRVGRFLGRGPEKWTVDDLVRVIASLTAIGERLTTPEEAWPNPEDAAPPPPPPPIAGKPKKEEAPPPAEPDGDGRPGPDDGQEQML